MTKSPRSRPGARRLALAAAFLLLAQACGGLLPGGDEAIEIGAIYPTGGGQGPGGRDELQGVEVAAALAARHGGPQIRLRVEAADAADAAPAAVRTLASRGVPVIVGSYGSTISLPAAEEAEKQGVVFWETGAVGEVGMRASSGELFFRFAPTGRALGSAAVGFVVDQLLPRRGTDPGSLRYAVTFVDDVYGRSVGRGALDDLAARGLHVAAELPYTLRTADYPALARQVAESGADVLVVAAYLEDGVAIRRAILDEQVPLEATIGTSSSYCMPEFGQRLGPDAVGVFASDKPDGDVVRPDALRPEAAAVLAEARAEYSRRHGREMSAAALSGFSAGWALFMHVMPSADEATAEGIADAARRAELPAGSLPNGSGLAFAPAGQGGDNLRAATVIWQWSEPGVRQVVWPAAFATAELREPAST